MTLIGAHFTRAHKDQEDHCTFTFDLFYEHMLSCISVFMFVNKAVEGSGTRALPNIWGRV